jgi:prevent-host-death family protein
MERSGLMRTVSVREARAAIGFLLDVVARGEAVVIERHGRPIARLVPIVADVPHLPDRSAFRQRLGEARESAREAVRAIRDEQRY